MIASADVDDPSTHGRRLSRADARLLESETPQRPVHGGVVLVVDVAEAPGFGFAEITDLVRSVLHQVPRYRQVVATTPLGLAEPLWVDDVEFDLSYHLRHAALPQPGTVAQLTEFAARVLSRPLDRTRPLWELYVVEAVGNDRAALIVKNSHALVGGTEHRDLLDVLLAELPDEHARIAPAQPWTPHASPSNAERLVSGAAHLASSPVEVLAAGQRLVQRPQRLVEEAVHAAQGVVAVATSGLGRPAPRSLLNVAPGRHRRLAVQRLALDDVRRVGRAFSTTVNDVVLTVVAEATGRFLRLRGARTGGVELRALVPLATTTPATDGAVHGPSGNEVVTATVGLPMGEMDPVERLRRVSEAFGSHATANRAAGAALISGMAGFAPPGLHAAAARLASLDRTYNFVVANVPGPAGPRYLLGAPLVAAFPYTPLGASQAFAVGITSLDGWLHVGLTADWSALPDIGVVAGYLRDSLDELVRNAEALDVRTELAMAPTPHPDRPPAELDRDVTGAEGAFDDV